jgi:hypothetical protein
MQLPEDLDSIRDRVDELLARADGAPAGGWHITDESMP